MEAASIGSHVHVSRDAVIGRRCILKDCCKVAPGAVLAPDTVVPPFALMAGNPAVVAAELPECTKDLHRDLAKNYYQAFKPQTAQ